MYTGICSLMEPISAWFVSRLIASALSDTKIQYGWKNLLYLIPLRKRRENDKKGKCSCIFSEPLTLGTWFLLKRREILQIFEYEGELANFGDFLCDSCAYAHTHSRKVIHTFAICLFFFCQSVCPSLPPSPLSSVPLSLLSLLSAHKAQNINCFLAAHRLSTGFKMCTRLQPETIWSH